MKINELPPVCTTNRTKKRVGRGMGSGMGKTSNRGQKGQKARSGGYHKIGFEGGQMPLQRRMPKRGFTNIFKKEFELVNLDDLKGFEAGAEVTVESLQEKGLVGKIKDGVKLLGRGEVEVALKITVDRASQSAIAKIEKAGGSVTVTAPAATDKAEG